MQFGWEFGLRFGGPIIGIVCAAVGGIAGFFVGWLPFVVTDACMRWSLTRKSVSELRERLNQEHDIGQHYISHIIIAGLLKRGEPVESFREVVVAQLASTSPEVWACGRRNAGIWFPELLGNSDDSDDERSPPIS